MESQQLITACIRSLLAKTGGHPSETIHVDAGVDWEAVVTLAKQHRIAPILLDQLPTSSVPNSAIAELQTIARGQRIRAMMMSDAFLALKRPFDEAQLLLMPIKGAAIANHYYPSCSMRYFDDVDALVPAGTSQQALALLQANGYRPHPNAGVPEWHHLAPHVHKQHRTLVEIHLDLFRRTDARWPIDTLWQRRIPIAIDGTTVETLSHIDALLYTAIHARHHLFHRLSAFIDAALIYQQIVADEQVEQLVMTAREAGCCVALGYMLTQIETLFGPIGDEGKAVIAGLGLMRGTGRLRLQRAMEQFNWQSLSRPKRSYATGPLARISELQLLDTVSDSIKLAWSLIRPPKEFVDQSYQGSYLKRFWQRSRLALSQLHSR